LERKKKKKKATENVFQITWQHGATPHAVYRSDSGAEVCSVAVVVCFFVFNFFGKVTRENLADMSLDGLLGRFTANVSFFVVPQLKCPHVKKSRTLFLPSPSRPSSDEARMGFGSMFVEKCFGMFAFRLCQNDVHARNLCHEESHVADGRDKAERQLLESSCCANKNQNPRTLFAFHGFDLSRHEQILLLQLNFLIQLSPNLAQLFSQQRRLSNHIRVQLHQSADHKIQN
jgi:hypothetical protein